MAKEQASRRRQTASPWRPCFPACRVGNSTGRHELPLGRRSHIQGASNSRCPMVFSSLTFLFFFLPLYLVGLRVVDGTPAKIPFGMTTGWSAAPPRGAGPSAPRRGAGPGARARAASPRPRVRPGGHTGTAIRAVETGPGGQPPRAWAPVGRTGFRPEKRPLEAGAGGTAPRDSHASLHLAGRKSLDGATEFGPCLRARGEPTVAGQGVAIHGLTPSGCRRPLKIQFPFSNKYLHRAG